MTRGLALALLLGSYGCATAVPSFAGGSGTPRGRYDLGFGGAARVAFGDVRPSSTDGTPAGAAADTHEARVDGPGPVPVAYARYGLPNGYDVGLLASGTLARVDVRRDLELSGGSTREALIVGLAPYAGGVPRTEDGDGRAVRVGLEVPLTYSVDFGGVYELWLGPRVAMEYVTGRFLESAALVRASAIGLRSGAVLGLGAGLRRVHAQLEVTAAWEQWWGDSVRRGGFVLIPAFALRFRL